MRTEKEMMDLIIGKAQEDDRIRAVIMNGSRTNPNVKKDLFQDYDIIYIVKDIQSFTCDHSWVDMFGRRVMMQMPEDKGTPPSLNDGRFMYLMQFMDGNRIDLALIPIGKIDELLSPDSLSLLLLDKDNIIGPLPPSSDKDYHIKRPTKKEFSDVCNEFWWICMNISKGIWREELTYAMFMKEQINRNVLIQMIEWYVGMDTDFTLSAGKFGKNFKELLKSDEWEEFVSTYSDANYENIWNSLFQMCELFRKIAIRVANHLNYRYPYEDDKNVAEYLKKVKNLPKSSNTL
ncbi:MAG TPA: aminoglycoside 6-adenylyltransferase [Pseudoneobacillus sp.]|nr:aminoglycoside 6-adenylyltransferase [Pseudoneobacillus sp.]